MTRALALAAFALGLYLVFRDQEVRAVRADLAENQALYDAFLSRRVGGKTFRDTLTPGTVAISRGPHASIACGVVEEKP